MPGVDSKVCTKCKLDLPLSEFYKKKAGRLGLNSRCKSCVKAYDKTRSDYYAKYRADHREEFAEYKRQWYEANKEVILAQCKARYHANRDVIAVTQAAWYQRHKDEMRAERMANPEKWREIRRLARLKSRDSRRHYDNTRRDVTQEQVDARVAYFGWKCWMCGGPYEHIDHVKPISKGGTSLPANLRPACADCNNRKKAKWPFTLEDATWLCLP